MPYVFVYGPDSLQARIYDRLGPSDVLGGAVLEGYALRFNKPSFKADDGLANVVRESGASAFGVLYELTRKQIDMLDGYYGGYQHERLQVTPIGTAAVEPTEGAHRPKGPVEALVFMARRTKDGLLPSAETLALTQKGAEENGAPAAFLEAMKKVSAGK